MGTTCKVCPIGLHWLAEWDQLQASPSLEAQFQQPSAVCSRLGWVPFPERNGACVLGQSGQLHSVPPLTLYGQMYPKVGVYRCQVTLNLFRGKPCLSICACWCCFPTVSHHTHFTSASPHFFPSHWGLCLSSCRRAKTQSRDFPHLLVENPSYNAKITVIVWN